MLSRRYYDDGKSIVGLNQTQKIARDSVVKKINEGLYKYSELSCDLCNSSDSETLAQKDRYGIISSTKICKTCGFVYTSPRMTDESYADFYNNEYRPLYVGKETPGELFFNDQLRRGKLIYKYLSDKDLLSPKMNVLEIGCGAGGILKAFSLAEHNVLGFDLGEEYLNYGKEKHSLDLRFGTLSDLTSDFTPDLIIYSHVLEHLTDIGKELNLIKAKTHPNTIIYIEVPGLRYVHKTYDSDFLKYLQSAHTMNFTANSLKAMMSKNGFQCIDIDESIKSVFRFAENNNTKEDFVNEYKSNIDYLSKTEKFRPFSFLKMRKTIWFIKLKVLSVLKK